MNDSLSGSGCFDKMKMLGAILFIMIFAAGCVDMIGGGRAYGEFWSSSIDNSVAIYDPDDVGVCGNVECHAMVCENRSGFFSSVFPSFVGGNCHFENLAGEAPVDDAEQRMELSRQTFNELIHGERENAGIRTFMIGIGPNFGEFGEANRWCNNRMTMAVQWLVGDEDLAYPNADPGRAICFLDKNTVPLYVLYSSGNLDDEKVNSAGLIAETLYEGGGTFTGRALPGPVGPVIITTEMDADLTDPQVRDYVLRQAAAIKGNCPDGADGEVYCMVALGSRLNDYEGLGATLDDPRADNIDLVAFGINSRRAISCNFNNLYLDAQDFSRFAWYEHDKPTVMPYILFDSAGDVFDETGDIVCSWSEGEMIRGYNAFFPNLPAFKDSGVIGAAAYDFNTTWVGVSANADPLGCDSCSLGRNRERLASWFSGCQRTTGIYRVDDDCNGCDDPDPPDCCEGNFAQTPGIPLVLPNQSGGGCNFGDQWDFIMNFRYGTGASNSFSDPDTGELQGPMPKLISCDACMNENINFPYADDLPTFTIADEGTERNRFGSFPGVSPETAAAFPDLNGKDITCTAYSELNYWAGVRNIDPMYVRAVAMTESGLDPCSTACSPKPDTTRAGCIPGNYGKGYNFMEDPSGQCDDRIEEKTPPGADPGDDPDYRVMGLGMMQVLNAPFTFWPDEYCDEENRPLGCGSNSNYYYDAVEGRDIDEEDRQDLLDRSEDFWGPSGDEDEEITERYTGPGRNRAVIDIETVKSQCGNTFNPYDPADAACLGTYIIELDLLTANAIISRGIRRHGDIFGVSRDADRRRVLQYYIASHLYFGSWNNWWIDEFDDRKGWTDAQCVDALGLGYDTEACHDVGDMKEEAAPGGCWGTNSLIDYIHRCGRYGKNDPGYNKLGYYRALVDRENGCDNAACPSWYRLFDLGEFEDLEGRPEGGNPYTQYGTEAPEDIVRDSDTSDEVVVDTGDT